MVCVAPGSIRIAASRAFAVSTQTMPVHSSSAKSVIAAALSAHGFQTTVLAEPAVSIVIVLAVGTAPPGAPGVDDRPGVTRSRR